MKNCLGISPGPHDDGMSISINQVLCKENIKKIRLASKSRIYLRLERSNQDEENITYKSPGFYSC